MITADRMIKGFNDSKTSHKTYLCETQTHNEVHLKIVETGISDISNILLIGIILLSACSSISIEIFFIAHQYGAIRNEVHCGLNSNFPIKLTGLTELTWGFNFWGTRLIREFLSFSQSHFSQSQNDLENTS